MFKKQTYNIPSYQGISPIIANGYRIQCGRPYIVKNLLLKSQVSMLAGPPNLGKSSIVASLAAHVASGRDIGPIRTEKAVVLYIAAEDANGILERAWPMMHNAEATNTAPLAVFDMAFNLMNIAEIESFIEYTYRLREAVNYDALFIVIDTLNLSIGDGDENSAQDMGRVIGHAQKIARKTEAHVMIVHHTGTSADDRPRGSTAMIGNIDTLLTLAAAQTPGQVVMVQQKQRSVRKGDAIQFEIRAEEVGEDDDGQIITVPHAVYVGQGGKPAMKTRVKAVSAQAERVADIRRVLQEAADQTPGAWTAVDDVKTRLGAPFQNCSAGALRKAIKRALDQLQTDGIIEGNNNRQYRLLVTRH